VFVAAMVGATVPVLETKRATGPTVRGQGAGSRRKTMPKEDGHMRKEDGEGRTQVGASTEICVFQLTVHA
jgi:hypothetical protein